MKTPAKCPISADYLLSVTALFWPRHTWRCLECFRITFIETHICPLAGHWIPVLNSNPYGRIPVSLIFLTLPSTQRTGRGGFGSVSSLNQKRHRPIVWSFQQTVVSTVMLSVTALFWPRHAWRCLECFRIAVIETHICPYGRTLNSHRF